MFKALKTFSGVISMVKGEERDICDQRIANDLLQAGYIEEIAPQQPTNKKKFANKLSSAESNGKENG